MKLVRAVEVLADFRQNHLLWQRTERAFFAHLARLVLDERVSSRLAARALAAYRGGAC